MAGINKVILVGNLGQDPELRYTPNGVPVCSLRLATSESYTDRASGERVTTTEWHNIVLWRGLAGDRRKVLENRFSGVHRRQIENPSMARPAGSKPVYDRGRFRCDAASWTRSRERPATCESRTGRPKWCRIVDRSRRRRFAILIKGPV